MQQRKLVQFKSYLTIDGCKIEHERNTFIRRKQFEMINNVVSLN